MESLKTDMADALTWPIYGWYYLESVERKPKMTLVVNALSFPRKKTGLVLLVHQDINSLKETLIFYTEQSITLYWAHMMLLCFLKVYLKLFLH